jgi:hypothetical protein
MAVGFLQQVPRCVPGSGHIGQGRDIQGTHRPRVREDQRMHRPRGALSKGRIVQGTQRSRNGTSVNFCSGTHRSGTLFSRLFPSLLAMMPPGDTLARRWRRLKKRCSFSSTGDNNKLVRSKSFTEQAGLEKARVLKNPIPVVFFWFFFGFFGFFGFFVFFIYLPRRQSF